MLHETIWFERQRYHEAEELCQAHLNGVVVTEQHGHHDDGHHGHHGHHGHDKHHQDHHHNHPHDKKDAKHAKVCLVLFIGLIFVKIFY